MNSYSFHPTIVDTVAGPDVYDSTTVKKEFEKISLDRVLNLSGLRIGIPKEYHCSEMAPEVVNVWKTTARLLEEGGASVTEVTFSMPIELI